MKLFLCWWQLGWACLVLLPIGLPLTLAAEAPAKKKIVLIAGRPSHAQGEHEYSSGCELLAKALRQAYPQVEVVVFHCQAYGDNWPNDPAVLAGASSVLFYANGEGQHPLHEALKQGELAKLLDQGAGLVCLHFAVEALPGDSSDKLKGWLGGVFETFYSVNPVWTADFKALPQHPVTQGVKPFSLEDEWYFNLRFAEGMKGVTPLLSAIPPDKVRSGGPKATGNDAHRWNDQVKAAIGKQQVEHLAWAYERPAGGRSFGLTGGHSQWGWGHDQLRKLVLNGIAWSAGLEIPADGIASATPTFEELSQHSKLKTQIERKLQGWNNPPPAKP